MMKRLGEGVGVLLVLAGVTFGLQGLGVVGGSAMSGKNAWAVIGPLIALVGVVLVVGGLRGASKDSASAASRRDPNESSGQHGHSSK
jgi:hypothetical protein